MNPNGGDCSVKVVCRVRPLSQKEKETSSFAVSFPSDTTVALGGRCYSYDQVFRPDSTQEDVYTTSAKPLVKDVLGGFNATIFAYGQTSSGKTHTMEGVLEQADMQGIIPRIVSDMFDQLYSLDTTVEVHIKVSYFEIYMEKIRDLLDITKVNLPIGETKSRVPYVKGVTERFVTMPEEVFETIEEGRANRRVAVTNMNAHSSRSHAIFLISVKQEHKESNKTIYGKLYLVDLAGSEKVDKTNAQGLTLDEAKTINKSLLALSNVIAALSEGNKPFIPYRDSKLTRVLQESLGGNARTTLIICCSPSSYNEAESKTTLLFGDRAKAIKNKVAVNIELTADEWKRRYGKLRDAHSRLKSLLESCEAELCLWRGGKKVPEEEQRKISLRDISPPPRDSSRNSASSPRTTPTKAYSPTPPDFEEKTRLTATLEEKEEMIRSQSELIERLNQQLHAEENSHKATKEECLALRVQMSRVSLDLETSRTELSEVMQALEELAVSYDRRDKEMEKSLSSNQLLEEQLGKLQQSVESKSRELSLLKDSSLSEKRKNLERMSTLFRDLHDVSSILGTDMEDKLKHLDDTTNSELSDEDFTKGRIHLSNLRSEVRTLAKQREVLETAEKKAREKAQCAAVELGSYKTKMAQYEAQNESLLSHLRQAEQRKAELEQVLEGLKEELDRLHSQENVLLSTENGVSELRKSETFLITPNAQGQSSLREERGSHVVESGRDYEVKRLQIEIADKEAEVASISREHKNQLLAMDTLMAELEELKERYSEERQLSAEARLQAKAKAKAEQDLEGLSHTVSREMERLNELRDRYFKHMSSRLKGGKPLDNDSLIDAHSPHQKEMQFLERNLEELDHAHKKVISENVEMSREIPRLRSLVANKSKRIGQLEHMIGETNEAANAECEKLHSEVEQMKQNFMAKLKDKERETQHSSAQHRRSSSRQQQQPLIDPLTGLVQASNRGPATMDHLPTEGRAVRRHGGPVFARPLPTRRSESLDSSTARERLAAVAGVALLGQRPKPPQFNTLDNPTTAATPTTVSNDSTASGMTSRKKNAVSSSKCGYLVLALVALFYAIFCAAVILH